MRRTIALIVSVSTLSALAVGCVPPVSPTDCTGTGTVAHRNLRYASSAGVAARLQALDLYVPVRKAGCAAAPLVVYVHGGGFAQGDKANKITDKVNLFNGEGWGFASLNYRLVGDAGSGATNGVYPAAEQDIAAAVAYLGAHATGYGLDARRIMLLGHSAGAFLVALVSTDGSFLQGAGRHLRDVVCTAPLDTTYDIAAQIASGGSAAAMYRSAFGNDPAVWHRASPPNNVTAAKGIPSFHIVTRGLDDRVAESQAFGATLRAAGIAADVQVTRGLTHEAVNAAVGKAGDTVVTPPLMTFFRSCAKTPMAVTNYARA
jgi:acetyl esterase/lipase